MTSGTALPEERQKTLQLLTNLADFTSTGLSALAFLLTHTSTERDMNTNLTPNLPQRKRLAKAVRNPART